MAFDTLDISDGGTGPIGQAAMRLGAGSKGAWNSPFENEKGETPMDGEYILELRNITKKYPGVTALDDVTVSLKKGETHALMGENGAGKSTLIKVLSGAITPDAGKILLDGKEYSQMTPALSKELGVGIVYQEFNLMPTLSVAENVFAGNLLGNKLVIDRKEVERRTLEIFRRMKVEINPKEKVENLSVAYMQLVEIAKILTRDIKILVMDEPTAPLTSDEVEVLFQIMDSLKQQGVTIIYISHRINEIFRVADRVTVMRDGKFIQVTDTEAITRDELIKAMVGREVSEAYPKKTSRIGEAVLQVENLCGNGVEDIHFEVHKGEILGLSGLVGAGRTETVRMIFGADMKKKGRILLNGQEIHIKRPKDAVRLGIGLIPEDRKRQGVFLGLPIQWNISMANMKDISKGTVINRKQESAKNDSLFNRVKIKAPGSMQLVRNLSGGNQQKVALAKWLAADCKVLIFDEPTRGIDVGARSEIYKLMNELCDQGIAILMISSDMEELLGMSDRIIVLSEGAQTGVLKKEEFQQEKILSLASGVR